MKRNRVARFGSMGFAVIIAAAMFAARYTAVRSTRDLILALGLSAFEVAFALGADQIVRRYRRRQVAYETATAPILEIENLVNQSKAEIDHLETLIAEKVKIVEEVDARSFSYATELDEAFVTRFIAGARAADGASRVPLLWAELDGRSGRVRFLGRARLCRR